MFGVLQVNAAHDDFDNVDILGGNVEFAVGPFVDTGTDSILDNLDILYTLLVMNKILHILMMEF
jgi:hypothetical protein